ncbi:hypothetical protein ACRS5S_01285 [Nocardia asiatica]|uniref:hypothetical protein n=1 Tax=Nocardia asiatica TaxID=209252 RepID=UPI00313EF26B
MKPVISREVTAIPGTAKIAHTVEIGGTAKIADTIKTTDTAKTIRTAKVRGTDLPRGTVEIAAPISNPTIPTGSLGRGSRTSTSACSPVA